MSNGFEPTDPTLFNLAAKAVEEGISKIRKLKEEKKYIGRYFDFPNMYYFDNGIPNFSTTSFSGPTDSLQIITCGSSCLSSAVL